MNNIVRNPALVGFLGLSMNKAILGALAALTLSAAAVSAHAATFLYSYTSNDGLEAATGTLNATFVSPGEWEATSGTITAFGPIEAGVGTLFPNPSPPTVVGSPSGFFIYDNTLEPSTNPLITFPGLLFMIGGTEVNIFSNGPGPGTYELQIFPTGAADLGNFALTQVGGAAPEPATWGMMIVGFLGMGSLLRARRTRAFVRA